MKQLIVFVILIFTFTNCHRTFICGMGLPSTKLNIFDDTLFTYHQYAGIIGDNKCYYSKGTIKKVRKNKYLLQSINFEPNGIRYNIEQSLNKNQNASAVKIRTDLYDEFFRFNRGKFRFFVNNRSYIFKSSFIDTLINVAHVDSIKIEIELSKSDLELSKPNYRLLKTGSIPILNGNNNIEISIPITSEEFDWIDISNKYLIKKRKFYEFDEKSVQVEKITTYNNVYKK
jgi:hypothetical protein